MKRTVVMYAVTAIDNGDSCDGRPRCLGVFKTRSEAVKYIEADIENYEDKGSEVNYDDWTATTCVWNLNEVSVEAVET